ncbi:hypothetical protein GW17_00049213 [Ensete ventricosum]|nr:hypothetical protein GW17_00049213 [Ensete ventricosum]
MKALVINIWGLWDLIIQRYDRCGWRVGLLQCSHSLKGARHVIGQGRYGGSEFDYSTVAAESSWEPRGVLQPEQKIEDSAKGEEMQRLQRL